MIHFVKSNRKTLSLIGVICIAVLSVNLIYQPEVGQAGNVMASMWQKDQINVPIISPEIDTPWRYTSEGWQSADGWNLETEVTTIRTFELVHPFVWAVSVLLAVVGTTVWASSEWEIARLLGRQ